MSDHSEHPWLYARNQFGEMVRWNSDEYDCPFCKIDLLRGLLREWTIDSDGTPRYAAQGSLTARTLAALAGSPAVQPSATHFPKCRSCGQVVPCIEDKAEPEARTRGDLTAEEAYGPGVSLCPSCGVYWRDDDERHQCTTDNGNEGQL